MRAVTKDGLHLDAVVHVHHAARFRDGGFIGVEFQFDELHRVAEHLVINFVHLVHSILPQNFPRMMPRRLEPRSYNLSGEV